MKIKNYLNLTKIKDNNEKNELINHFLNTYLITRPYSPASISANKNYTVYLTMRVKYKSSTSTAESYRDIIIGYPFSDSFTREISV